VSTASLPAGRQIANIEVDAVDDRFYEFLLHKKRGLEISLFLISNNF
jgi:hypothetical protein